MADAFCFQSVMERRGWNYEDLETLCDDFERLYAESVQAQHLLETYRELCVHSLRRLAQERARPRFGVVDAPRVWELS